MLTNLDARLAPHAPAVLSIFRVVFALLFLCHATSHLFGWPMAEQQAPVGVWPYWFAGVIELVTGILIGLGLFTRIAAFIASGTMAFAYFTQHLPKGLIPLVDGGEAAVLLLLRVLPAGVHRRRRMGPRRPAPHRRGVGHPHQALTPGPVTGRAPSPCGSASSRRSSRPSWPAGPSRTSTVASGCG